MQLIHVEAKSDEKIDLKPDEIEKLPKKIALFTAVQFIGELKNIKKQLEKAGKEVVLIKPSHCKYPGQLLGCSIEIFNNGV